MNQIFFSIFLFITTFSLADVSSYLKKDFGEKNKKKQIRNIDFIYLINLDQRPEKLKNCLDQLEPYGISPHRFPAIYGWELPEEAFRQIGVKFSPGMKDGRWVSDASNSFQRDFLREECYGKTFFHSVMTPGAIGCTLSHLSILQDAYDSNFETIWIMEDDIHVLKDPKVLADLIDQLDSLVGKEGWDVLYTDMDSGDVYFENFSLPMCTADNDFEQPLKGDFRHFWRPDIDLSNSSRFSARTVLNKDFIRIGSRSRTHSMVVRRSGMKKILDYEKNNHIFLAYDQEIATVPGIQLVNLRSDLVTFGKSPSDTEKKQFHGTLWEDYKKETLDKISEIPGWSARPQADKLMEFIRKKKPRTCVEIGAFGGSTTYQIARVLQFLKQGTVHAIDAWDNEAAIEGLQGEKTLAWWSGINMNMIKEGFFSLLSQTSLEKYCHPIHQKSSQAASLFSDASIDFLYIDGNDSEKGNLENVELYLPKVKEGGYICLNAAFSPNKNQAIAFLMKHCYWIKEGPTEDCIFFQKKTNLKNQT